MEGERLPKRRSLVWNHFIESKDRKKAECYHCNQSISISSGSIGNLSRHLRVRHGVGIERLEPTPPVINIEVASVQEAAEVHEGEHAQGEEGKISVVASEVSDTPVRTMPTLPTLKRRKTIPIEFPAKLRKQREDHREEDDDTFMTGFIKYKKPDDGGKVDEMDLFFKSMCQTTKKMPSLFQIRIKRQIMNIVSEAEEELIGVGTATATSTESAMTYVVTN